MLDGVMSDVVASEKFTYLSLPTTLSRLKPELGFAISRARGDAFRTLPV